MAERPAPRETAVGARLLGAPSSPNSSPFHSMVALAAAVLLEAAEMVVAAKVVVEMAVVED